jgi:hypothetical protein
MHQNHQKFKTQNTNYYHPHRGTSYQNSYLTRDFTIKCIHKKPDRCIGKHEERLLGSVIAERWIDLHMVECRNIV